MTRLLCFALLLLLQEGTQSDTGVIRGRITEAGTDSPIAGAIVKISSPGTTLQRSTTTRSDGTYEFTGLASAVYGVEASSGEHDATYIARGFSSPPTRFSTMPFLLRHAEIRTGMDIALQRAGVISGRVVDEDGEPLTGILVRVLRAPGGASPLTGTFGSTDDRGAFRIFGVIPGRYFVCADAVRPPVPRQADQSSRPRVPLPTCHPSVTTDSLGHEISLTTGEVGGVELRMPRRPVLQLTATVLDAAGLPARGAVLTVARLDPAGSRNGITVPSDSGLYTIGNLIPGRYHLSARSGQTESTGLQWSVQEVELVHDDEHVILTMAPSAQVKGRVLFEGDPPDGITRLAIQVETGLPVGGVAGQALTVTPGLPFELKGLAGPSLVIPTQLPPGWIVKAVRYRGADITNLLTTFGNGSDEIEVVLTRRRAYLTGLVLDAEGRPAARARVVAVPAERTQWPRFNLLGPSSGLKDGRFWLERRAGEYLVLALTEDDYDSLGANVPLALIERVAQRISLAEDEQREIELRVVPLEPGR